MAAAAASVAIQHHGGWDRPAIYNVFLLVPHWKLTNRVVVVAQAMLKIYALDAMRRGFAAVDTATAAAADGGAALPRHAAAPIVGPLMPELFTSLPAVVLAPLAVPVPRRRLPGASSRFG